MKMKNKYTDFCAYRDGNCFVVCELSPDFKIYANMIHKFLNKKRCLNYIKNRFYNKTFNPDQYKADNNSKEFNLFSWNAK